MERSCGGLKQLALQSLASVRRSSGSLSPVNSVPVHLKLWYGTCTVSPLHRQVTTAFRTATAKRCDSSRVAEPFFQNGGRDERYAKPRDSSDCDCRLSHQGCRRGAKICSWLSLMLL